MKLDELSSQKSQQVKKVFEQYFQEDIPVQNLSKSQTQNLLGKINKLLEAVRSTEKFYQSQQSPAYLKLLMLQESLGLHFDRFQNTALFEESEVAHAQVVLAAQDMVDQVQGMLEDASELQFKELPAVVDSIRNQIGSDQSTAFNSEATAALSMLVQNLQSAKQQLDAALGMLTGQAAPMAGALPQPGQEGSDLAGGIEPNLDLDTEIDIEPEISKPSAGLGRERR